MNNTTRNDDQHAAPRLNGDTRLSVVLEGVPGALEYIVGLRPHDFERLRHPFMGKYMPPRISLRRVAAMAGITEAQLLRDLNTLAGQDAEAEDVYEATLPAQSPLKPPSWMAGVESENLHAVDVRPIDDVLGDPFPPISVAVKRMPPGSVIVLWHRWEPQPLYDIWQKMGIEWFARQEDADEWQIFIFKPAHHPLPTPAAAIAIELRHLSADEVAPRVVALLKQLRAGQRLEITGATPADEARMRRALEECGVEYEWSRGEAAPGKPMIRIAV